MDHIRFVSELPAAEKAALQARSNRHAILHLTGHLGALVAMGSYIAWGGPFWPLVLLPYGAALVFLFTLSHECTHGTPFATPWVNTVIGHAVALPLMLPFVWFRYFHLAHHKHTNDPARDPELALGGRPADWRAYALYLSGWPYWSGNARRLWRNARGTFEEPYLPKSAHRRMTQEARVMLAAYWLLGLSLLVSPAVFWLWILPALLGQPLLRLFLLAEHGHCPPVANMLENTRTTFTNRLVRFFAWNMPYHAEHHAMPMVPFHALPALHSKLRAHLISTSPGYGHFTRRYLRSLHR